MALLRSEEGNALLIETVARASEGDVGSALTALLGLLAVDRLSARTRLPEDAAIGAYYQGLTSVRANGYYADTTRYVANVRAHMDRLADS